MNTRKRKKIRVLAYLLTLALVVTSFIGFTPDKVEAASNSNLKIWVSESAMGSAISNATHYTNQYYYICFEVVNSSGQRVNANGSMLVANIMSSNGYGAYSQTFFNTNNGYIQYMPTASGTYNCDTVFMFEGQILQPRVSWTVVSSGGNGGNGGNDNTNNNDNNNNNNNDSNPNQGTYTLTYDANGGTFTGYNYPTYTETYKIGESCTIQNYQINKMYTITYDSDGGTALTNGTLGATFSSWNTKADGTGTGYYPPTVFGGTRNLYLYAQYKNPTIPSAYLPNITKSGYQFQGWYTAKTGGNKISTSNTLNGNATFYARWTKSDGNNNNDGQNQDQNQNNDNGQGDGNNQNDNSHQDDGKDDGGSSDDDSHGQDNGGNGSNPQRGSYTLENSYYSFINSNQSLGYSSNYKIPLSVFKMFFDDSRASYFYNYYSDWGGSCFGFSSTSLMFNTSGTGMYVRDYNSYASKVHDLSYRDTNTKENMSVRTMLEAAQIMQFDDTIQSEINGHYTHGVSSAMNTMINGIKNGTAIPPVVCVFRDGVGGHAIVPTYLETVNSTTDRLHVYDCNFGNQDRYITLTKSGSTYTGWYYPLNDMYDFGSSYSGSYFSWVSFNSYYKVWNNRKKIANTTNVISINADQGDIEIWDDNNRKVAAIKNGKVESYNKNIYQLCELAIRDEGPQTHLYIPTGEYTVHPTKMTRMTVSIAGETKNTNINLTTDQNVSFNLSDASNEIEITPKKGTDYSVALQSDGNDENIIKAGKGDGKKKRYAQKRDIEYPVVGTMIKDAKTGAYYKITKQGKEVAFAKPANTKITSLTIPATVTLKDVKYKVTSVSAKACYKCKKLKRVKIKVASLSKIKIGKNAFKKKVKITTL